MEGGCSKALLLRKEDGSEIIAKIPFSIAGPPKHTTASEVAVLQYLKIAKSIKMVLYLRLISLVAVHTHTQVPVPKVLAWSSDPSNPVGAEYIIMEKASGIQLFKTWGAINEYDQFCLVKQLTKLVWNDVEFAGKCRFSFSEDDMHKHDQQFEEYCEFHRVQEITRKHLDTDSEGWIAPQLDFAMKQQQNERLLQMVMYRSNEYNKSPEGVQRIWPF